MSVGKFLDEMQDEPNVLVGFTIFLAEDFLAENESNSTADQRIAEQSSLNQLRTNIEQMKNDFSNAEKDSFDKAAF